MVLSVFLVPHRAGRIGTVLESIMSESTFPLPLRVALFAPAMAFFAAFWLLPVVLLVRISADGHPVTAYWAIVTNANYLHSLLNTVVLSLAVTSVSLLLATVSGLFLARRTFPLKSFLMALLGFPLIFPGVVVGFLVIMLAGRQGLIGALSLRLTGDKWIFAYSMGGLFLGYLYFSIPRVLVSVIAATSKLDPSLIEAARALGASSWQVARDVLLPALQPVLVASGALCFATSMGAFGTAFTLGTNIDVLPMTIYTAFTLNADMAGAAALSIVLGVITWLTLALSRQFGAANVAVSA